MQSLSINSIFAERYRTIRSIAAGGMGAVYEVEHTETGRRLALKVLLPGLLESDDSRERFKQEARVTANLECPFLVQVLDAGIDTSTSMPFIVMELLRGEDLGARLLRHGPFSPALTLSYLYQVALALDYTHNAQIIHRDLKPENIFYTRLSDDSVLLKILDFGLAKTIKEGSVSASSTVGIGTPLYMAPEQFLFEQVSPATDIYALGMLAFSFLAGHPYWDKEARNSGSIFSFATTASKGPFESASNRALPYGIKLPQAFDSWFAQITSVFPAHRHISALAAVEDLAIALDLEPPAPLLPASLAISKSGMTAHLTRVSSGLSTSVSGSKAPHKHRKTFVSLGVGLVATTVVSILFFLNRNSQDTMSHSAVQALSAATPTAPIASPVIRHSELAPEGSSPVPQPSASPALSSRRPGKLSPQAPADTPVATPASPSASSRRSLYGRE